MENKEIATNETFFSIDEISQSFQQEGSITGLENLNASDIKMPNFKLLQPTSREVAESKGKLSPGQFLNSVTGEGVDQLEVVFLAINKTRVRWARPFKRGQDPLCRSFDAVRSENGAIACDTCPYSQWNRGDKGADNRPECNLSYTLVGKTDFDNSAPTPFRMIISGASISNAKDFFTTAVAKKLPLYAFRLVLTSKLESNDQGSYYVIKIDLKKLVDPKDGVAKPVGTNPAQYKELENLTKSLQDLFRTDYMQKDVMEESSEMAPPPSQNAGLF